MLPVLPCFICSAQLQLVQQANICRSLHTSLYCTHAYKPAPASEFRVFIYYHRVEFFFFLHLTNNITLIQALKLSSTFGLFKKLKCQCATHTYTGKHKHYAQSSIKAKAPNLGNKILQNTKPYYYFINGPLVDILRQISLNMYLF